MFSCERIQAHKYIKNSIDDQSSLRSLCDLFLYVICCNLPKYSTQSKEYQEPYKVLNLNLIKLYHLLVNLHLMVRV